LADRQIDRPFWHVKKETSIQLLTQIIKSCRWTNLLFCLQIFILSYLEINSSAAKDQKWGRDEVSHETFVCLGLYGEKALSFHFLVFDLFPAFAVKFFFFVCGCFWFSRSVGTGFCFSARKICNGMDGGVASAGGFNIHKMAYIQ
jgi:hypothetical protein